MEAFLITIMFIVGPAFIVWATWRLTLLVVRDIYQSEISKIRGRAIRGCDDHLIGKSMNMSVSCLGHFTLITSFDGSLFVTWQVMRDEWRPFSEGPHLLECDALQEFCRDSPTGTVEVTLEILDGKLTFGSVREEDNPSPEESELS